MRECGGAAPGRMPAGWHLRVAIRARPVGRSDTTPPGRNKARPIRNRVTNVVRCGNGWPAQMADHRHGSEPVAEPGHRSGPHRRCCRTRRAGVTAGLDNVDQPPLEGSSIIQSDQAAVANHVGIHNGDQLAPIFWWLPTKVRWVVPRHCSGFPPRLAQTL